MPSRLRGLSADYALIVDDDVDERMVTTLALQHEGVMSVGCTNGLEALKFLVEACKQDKLPIIIFLDINMPLMTGWDLMSVMRLMRSPIRDIPIVICSAELIPDNDLYKVLHKPFAVDQLLEQIKRATEGRTKLEHQKD